jgi:glycosyltransferase involved in cell wall biosynthesis
MVSTQRLWHGGEEQAALLARGLRRRAHRPVILARHDGLFAQRMADEGFEVLGFRGNGRSPMALWQIRALLRRLRPDVLHYNDPHAISAAGLASLGLEIGARVAMRHVCFPIRWTFRYRVFCDRLIGVSHAVTQSCRESGIPSQSIRVVHGGMDPERWQLGDRARGRAALGIRDGQTVLLTVAQLAPCKGHAHLLEAVGTVAQQRPDVQLVLAGDGPLRAPLEDQARRLGIDGRVHFLGHRRDVPDLLAAADLFVLPSLSEALGIVLIEAMLTGCALVTTTAGGIGDLVGDHHPDGQSVAWMVPPGDPQAMAGAILEALDDRALRADRVERARRRVLERFTADHMVEATLAVYREILTERGGPSQ